MPTYDLLKNRLKGNETPSEIESTARGLAQGASLGYADELAGGYDALKSLALNTGQRFEDAYKEGRDESRELNKLAEETNPKSYQTGDIVGSVGSAFAPGVSAIKGIKGLTALGAATGAGRSEADLTEGNIQDFARDTAIGGSMGYVAGNVAQRFPNLLQKFRKSGESADDSIRALTREEGAGLNPEIEQFKLSGETGPSINKLNKQLYKISEGEKEALKQQMINENLDTVFDNVDDYVQYKLNKIKALRNQKPIPKVSKEEAEQATQLLEL